ncbi:MAG TPA: DUF4173 domain-containing protein [Symbiobacteriaceae bacterium]|jgi:hypothetical protein
MSGTTKLGVAALVVALGLGVLADALLRTPLFGLNGFFWILCLLGGYWLLVRREAVGVSREGWYLLAPALLAAIGFLWRDSPFLLMLDVAGLAIAFALMVGFGRTGGLGGASVPEYIARGVSAVVLTLFGPFVLVLRDVRWSELPRDRRSVQMAAVGRGLLIALPLVVVFGALFMAADAVFEHIITTAFGIDIGQAFSHVIFIGFWAWLAAGFFWAGLIQKWPEATAVPRATGLSLGLTEMAIVLGLLNALFLAFVVVQFRYFFGGAALVEASTGLTFADYARRGFFELAAVSALVLPVLLGSHFLLPRERPDQERLYRWLAGALVGQLFIIMASALKRMMLYERAFGLTEARLYTTAFMVWLAVLFVWFGVTVLRGRWERFAAGVLISGYVALAALHLLNPDALIAGVNVQRLETGRRFDSHYLTTLSADATPVLLAALPKLEGEDRFTVANGLLNRRESPIHRDWRSWNWGRSQEDAALAANLDALKAMAGR